ncbi:TolC family protein [Novimethylophilus kurashikiensis]|nr:TolC family protein [Novimethylophilus kurashikiensis]
MRTTYRLLALLVASLLGSTTASAGPFTEGYAAARGTDSLFLSAAPEKEAAGWAAMTARAAYLPSAQLQQQQQYSTSSLTSRTFSVSQPVFSIDKAATVMESTPRLRSAESVYVQRENDLATRYFKALADWLKASEGLRLTSAKKTAYTQQYEAAKRALLAGEGTVSDRQDALLRLEQAQSEEVLLEAQQQAAANEVQMISGVAPNDTWSTLTVGELPKLPEQEDCLREALAHNPQLLQAQSDKEMADLGVWKARGALAPQVSVVVAHTTVSNFTTEYTGIQVSMPLGVAPVGQALSASANADRQRWLTLDAENKVKLDVRKLYAQFKAGVAEVSMRKTAVETASLGVEANMKSYQGGVRTKTDVLNAIQALYQAKQDLVTAQIALAESYLNLELTQGTRPEAILQSLDGYLFAKIDKTSI